MRSVVLPPCSLRWGAHGALYPFLRLASAPRPVLPSISVLHCLRFSMSLGFSTSVRQLLLRSTWSSHPICSWRLKTGGSVHIFEKRRRTSQRKSRTGVYAVTVSFPTGPGTPFRGRDTATASFSSQLTQHPIQRAGESSWSLRTTVEKNWGDRSSASSDLPRKHAWNHRETRRTRTARRRNAEVVFEVSR